MVGFASRRSSRARNRAIFLAAALAASPQVRAGLTYDLRFSDGTHSVLPTAGATYTVELWAQVGGTDGTTANEGLTNSYVTILSTQFDGGSLLSGGLSSATA